VSTDVSEDDSAHTPSAAGTIALLRDALETPGSIHPGLAGHILKQLDELDGGRNQCCAGTVPAVA
jgi:hypothetical protein